MMSFTSTSLHQCIHIHHAPHLCHRIHHSLYQNSPKRQCYFILGIFCSFSLRSCEGHVYRCPLCQVAIQLVPSKPEHKIFLCHIVALQIVLYHLKSKTKCSYLFCFHFLFQILGCFECSF